MQEVLIATTCSSQFENASAHIKNKSLLYDKDKDKLYIKYKRCQSKKNKNEAKCFV